MQQVSPNRSICKAIRIRAACVLDLEAEPSHLAHVVGGAGQLLHGLEVVLGAAVAVATVISDRVVLAVLVDLALAVLGDTDALADRALVHVPVALLQRGPDLSLTIPIASTQLQGPLLGLGSLDGLVPPRVAKVLKAGVVSELVPLLAVRVVDAGRVGLGIVDVA